MNTVEAVDMVSTEDAVDAEEAVVAPVRLVFISTWTVQRLMFYRRYRAS